MNPRGVTLVEILAAVSIMVVVTALSLPAVHGRLAGARMEAAQGLIESAAIATRAEAVKQGKALELFARAGKEGMDVLVRDLEQPGSSKQEGSEKASPRHETWWGVLPPGFSVTKAKASEQLAEDETPVRTELRIAVFCPDGTAITSDTCCLSDGKEKLSITVNGWVGGASFATFALRADGPDETPKREEGPK